MSEQMLSRELERRAEDVQPRHLGFEEVRTRALGIRRRRRATACGAAAAVVAGVLLLPGLVGGSPRSSAPDPAPAPPRAHGDVAVLHDGRLTLPSGASVELPVADEVVTQLALLSDGRIVVAVSEPQSVQVFGPDGSRAGRYPVAANAITTSADDRLVAWVDESYRVEVLESGVPDPVRLSGIPMPGEAFPSLDAVAGSDCADGGCTVWGGDGTTTSDAATLGGSVPVETSVPLRISDVDPTGGRWAVTLPPGPHEQYGCAAVYELGAESARSTSCEASDLRFAPDGRHLMGMRGDNQMAGQVEVYDQGLQETFVYDPGKGVAVSGAAWGDASHLLVVTATLDERPRWSLLWVPIDGTAPEVLEGPVDGPNPESGTAFRLAQ